MVLLFQAGGLPWLVAVFAVVVTAAAVCLSLLLRRTGLTASAAVVLTLVGALAGSTAWGARPQLLNVLFCGLLLLGLIEYRAGRLHAWMLPPFIWLWANLHSAFVVGVIISGLFVAGEAVDAWRTGEGTMPRRRLTALAAAIGAGCVLSFINPFGIQTILFSLGTLTSPLIQNNIQEWASPDFHSLPGLLVEGIIFLLLAGLAALRWTPARPMGQTATLGAINLLLLMVVATGMIAYRAVPNLRPEAQAASIKAALPVQAADALARAGRPVRVFNYYDYGGYLLWRLYPAGGRVYIDGAVVWHAPQSSSPHP